MMDQIRSNYEQKEILSYINNEAQDSSSKSKKIKTKKTGKVNGMVQDLCYEFNALKV